MAGEQPFQILKEKDFQNSIPSESLSQYEGKIKTFSECKTLKFYFPAQFLTKY